ncbi:MAG: PLP-dependent aminotransferase family protein [Reyranella sp.]|nr:PLP-dependent aminotransferase family protein [Reyranella sp.]
MRSDIATLSLSIERTVGVPLQRQLVDQLRNLILSGRLQASAKLPSSRQIAEYLGVSRNTSLAAIDQLIAEGYVEARHGAGVYVGDIKQTKPRSVDRLPRRASVEAKLRPARPFQVGTIDSRLFPNTTWARLLSRTWRHPGQDLLGYADPFGWMPLREAIADHLYQWRGIECSAAQVIVTSGAAESFDLVARCLLKPGDTAYVEEPGYPLLIEALVSAGVRLKPVQVDEGGFVVPEVSDGRSRARAAFVTPSRQFPLGVIMPVTRRLRLLEWAKACNCTIIEDDFDSEFRFRGAPLPALMSLAPNGRVVYAGTFSKVLSPLLRLGFMVAPMAQLNQFRLRMQRRGQIASMTAQPALAEFINSGGLSSHIRRCRGIYAARQRALLSQFARAEDVVFINAQDGGLHLIAEPTTELSQDYTDEELCQIAETIGVTIKPLSAFYHGRPVSRGLVLGFAGFDERKLAASASRLVNALRRAVKYPA